MKRAHWLFVAGLCLPVAAAEQEPTVPVARQAPAAPAPSAGGPGSGAAPNPPGVAAPTVEELLRRIDALTREVEELKRKQAELEAAKPEERPAPKPDEKPATPQPKVARPPRASAELYGYLQAQFESTPRDGSRLMARRARLGVRGNLEKEFSYYVTGEFASSVLLRDAAIQWNGWKNHHVRFGQFLVPFSFEGFESSTRLPTIERSFIVDAIYDNREAGIGVFNEDDPEQVVGYGVALINGTGRNEFVATTRHVGAARVQIRNPRSKPLLGGQLVVGLSTKQGHAYNFNRERPEDEAYGVDATFTRGRLLLRGEWLRGRFDDLIRHGYYGLAVYRLSHRWEALARYEEYDEDPGPLGAHRTTLGVNYYLSPSTRMMLDYDFVAGPGLLPFDTAGSSVGTNGLRFRVQTIF